MNIIFKRDDKIHFLYKIPKDVEKNFKGKLVRNSSVIKNNKHGKVILTYWSPNSTLVQYLVMSNNLIKKDDFLNEKFIRVEIYKRLNSLFKENKYLKADNYEICVVFDNKIYVITQSYVMEAVDFYTFNEFNTELLTTLYACNATKGEIIREVIKNYEGSYYEYFNNMSISPKVIEIERRLK